MDEKLIKEKIEKSIEIICSLYKENLIKDAYIIGSVARGEYKKESDIDIVIINPIFLVSSSKLIPFWSHDIDPSTLSEGLKKREFLRNDIVEKLKNIGVKFKFLRRKGNYGWYQLYKGDIFHLLPFDVAFHLQNLPNIRITRDLC